MLKMLLQLFLLTIPILAIDNATNDWISISKQKLSESLQSSSLQFGAPAFVRIFKEEQVIEVWLKSNDSHWVLFKDYKICAVSGELGPKQKEGDKQAPEGVYYITRKCFNPQSKYHLSIDIGYPNRYDRLMKRTGGNIVIHGYCASIGCFAIDNEGIEELYGLLAAAIKKGQDTIPVHIFPFKLTDKAFESHMGLKEDRQWVIFRRMSKSNGSVSANAFKYDEFKNFWWNLKLIYDYFERTSDVPTINAALNGYTIIDRKSGTILPK